MKNNYIGDVTQSNKNMVALLISGSGVIKMKFASATIIQNLRIDQKNISLYYKSPTDGTEKYWVSDQGWKDNQNKMKKKDVFKLKSAQQVQVLICAITRCTAPFSCSK